MTFITFWGCNCRLWKTRRVSSSASEDDAVLRKTLVRLAEAQGFRCAPDCGVPTVRTHLRHIYEKLYMRSGAAIVKYLQ